MTMASKNLTQFFELVKAAQEQGQGVWITCNDCAKHKIVNVNKKDAVVYITDHSACKEKIRRLEQSSEQASSIHRQSARSNRYDSDVDSGRSSSSKASTEWVVGGQTIDKGGDSEIETKVKELEQNVESLQKERDNALKKITELEASIHEIHNNDLEMRSKLEVSEKTEKKLSRELENLQRQYDEENIKMGEVQSGMSLKMEKLEHENDKLKRRIDAMKTTERDTNKKLEETNTTMRSVENERGSKF